jgi:hypothetical protein
MRGTANMKHQIDEAVYELFGLTEEEIKIVESACAPGNRTSADKGKSSVGI